MRRACSPAAQHHHHPSPPGTDRHNGPVWQVAWAHPKFGSILASCSYDRQVIIWKELSRNNWVQIYQHRGHDGSGKSARSIVAGWGTGSADRHLLTLPPTLCPPCWRSQLHRVEPA
eukprot:scaffold80298_cov21-Tisochrysis_lutea.AAC.1